ncbi:PEF-CTERM sorting domain-containing protein [Methanosarcina sp.]|uniref:PEF-CTERM sorting domain-containing protein n=1 Tax=Methanosarcina sp. TaxID=2213 RepID=UPI002C59EAC6|nr:PEF-CTERM sorting domain-containing protein [Methanosarcina sp.]HOW13550.1 PEF-CTERM sorting domain-containing protein [Methanosarcina sp.]
MVKIGFLFGLLSLLLLANTCSAAVELTVTPVEDENVTAGGTISYLVTVNATEDPGFPQIERFSIQNPQPNWSYIFNPEELTLEKQGDLKTSTLNITVPEYAEVGKTYHVVIADGYNYEDLSFTIEHDESGINPNVQQVPEFPSIALPVAAVLGLVIVFGRKKE